MKMQHHPVLLDPVVTVLRPRKGETYLDGTAGYGGHAAAIGQHIGTQGRMILVDRDAHATQGLIDRFGDEAEIIHASYLEGAERLL